MQLPCPLGDFCQFFFGKIRQIFQLLYDGGKGLLLLKLDELCIIVYDYTGVDGDYKDCINT